MMRGIFLEAHISDLHFGVMDPSIQYNILKEQFIDKIANLNLNIISINGDIFDHKFMSNSDVIMYAMKFINDLVTLCKLKRITLIIIHGTQYHDAGQLKLFYNYTTDPNLDIRIVETVRFENVNGKRILCIPEMYNMGDAYYSNYLYDDLYDAVYMHGTFEKAIYGKNEEDLNSDREPVFSMNNFINCAGPIISGHVHKAGCFNNHFYYTGSPYRWCFGEEEPKGFIILMHDLDNRYYNIHFEEIKSFRYDTINLDHMLQSDPKDIIDYINSKKSQGIDHIRLEITDEYDRISILKDFFKTDNSVVIKYDAKQRQEKIEQEKLREKYKQYDYIIDPNLSEHEILTRYINQNMGYVYITTDELIKLLQE